MDSVLILLADHIAPPFTFSGPPPRSQWPGPSPRSTSTLMLWACRILLAEHAARAYDRPIPKAENPPSLWKYIKARCACAHMRCARTAHSAALLTQACAAAESGLRRRTQDALAQRTHLRCPCRTRISDARAQQHSAVAALSLSLSLSLSLTPSHSLSLSLPPSLSLAYRTRVRSARTLRRR
jgi:hypothetical protein